MSSYIEVDPGLPEKEAGDIGLGVAAEDSQTAKLLGL
jgi:hypothetical protein